MPSNSVQTDPTLQVATFRFDVTPPIGHSLCGGWITPVIAIDDPLDGLGFVLLGAGDPIVICTIDWTALANEAYAKWQLALAKAAGTTPDRVIIHCVHQHNAPFACTTAEQLVAEQGDLPHIIDLAYFNQCIQHSCNALKDALGATQPVTKVSRGEAVVDRVASNRRIYRDSQGQVIANRHSIGRDEAFRHMPEGVIDPFLKTIALHNEDRKAVCCHFYATHPMSYYGDGRVTTDIAGLARRRRQQDEPDCLHIYFTGCAGNIAAGKYNDGTPEARKELTDRLYNAMVQSEAHLAPTTIETISWDTTSFLPQSNPCLDADALALQLHDRTNETVDRNRPALMLGWLDRLNKKIPLSLSVLHINDISLLSLPGECFIEYQLRTQAMAGDRFLAIAAYGDGGPWYIPVAEEYSNGGYEVSVAFCAPTIDVQISQAIKRCLQTA